MTRRLLISYLVITLVVLTLLEVPLGIFYAQRERDRFTSDVERDASVLATIYEDDLEGRRLPSADAADLYEDRTGARVVVVDGAGLSVVDTEAPVDRDFSTRPEIVTALEGARASGIRRSDTLNTSLLYVAVPVASGGVVHGALRITLDASRVDGRILRFWAGLAGIAVVITTVVGLAAWALARSVTRPIRRLQDNATRYASGDLATDGQPATGPPEIRELNVAMNTMASRLTLLIDEQRSFVADASHQLRTPLTAMRLRLENLQSRVPSSQVGELDSVIEESTRLATLVDDLLQLARADEQAPVGVVDLGAMVDDRAEMWLAFVADRGIAIDLQTPAGPVLAQAVPGAVEQVLDNLIDNAQTASPDHGTVRIELVSGPNEHVLSVSDEGPGLSDEDKERAVRRFWRGDASRSGTGLGLAIATALVEGSGGSMELADAPGHGLRVVVRLVAATAASAPMSSSPAESTGSHE